MKMRHVYIVTRELGEIKKPSEKLDFFGGMQEEAGEYLYGGGDGNETITVELHGQDEKGNWNKIS